MAAELQQLEATGVAIGVAEARVQRANQERYAFYRMLNATDRVLGRLEELNRDGVKVLAGDVYVAIRRELAELPSSCIEVLVDSFSVQEVLDSVFEVQERLFCWRDPDRGDLDDEEAPEVDVELEGRIVTELGEHPGGLWAQALAERFQIHEQTAVRRLARVMADMGRIGCEVERTRNGKEARRYFAVGEGGGGE